MRNKIITLTSALVLSSSAYATTARTLALGMSETDNEGLYHVEDNRNIFINAANIHDYANSVILEWGDAGQAASAKTNLKLDKDQQPKAKGGFLRKSGKYVYGAYLGNESNTSVLLRALATSANGANGTGAGTSVMLSESDNQLDLFFGGGDDMKWAVNFVYSKGEDESRKDETSAMASRFGVKTKKWNAFVNMSLAANSKNTVAATESAVGTAYEQEFDGQFGIHLGGAYNIGNAKAYAYLKQFSWDQKDGSAVVGGRGKAGTSEGSFTSWAVGYGTTIDAGDGNNVFTNIAVRSKKVEVDLTTKAEADNFWVPVTIGYEGKANSWLTLRGSIVHNIYGYRKNKNFAGLNAVAESFAKAEFGLDTDGKKTTLDNSTDVRAGATLNFGNLNIDGMIGGVLDQANTEVDENGSLRMDELMYRVGMTYNF